VERASNAEDRGDSRATALGAKVAVIANEGSKTYGLSRLRPNESCRRRNSDSIPGWRTLVCVHSEH
jgi:hypothetical protein